MWIEIVNSPPEGEYRFLCFADLHLDDYGEDIYQDKTRFTDRVDFLIKVFSYAFERDITDIFCLGDLFHSRTKLSIPLLSYFSNLLDLFQENFPGVKCTVLRGNHDTYLKDLSMSSLHPFRRENFRFIDEITFLKEKKICLVPFGKEPTGAASVSGIDIVFFMHTEFLGAVNNGYKVMKSDLDPRKFGESVVLSGHYHQKQFVTERVFYIGSALQHSFGERNNETGFWECSLDLGRKVLKMYRVNVNSPRYYVVEDIRALESLPADSYVRVAVQKEEYRQIMSELDKYRKKFRKLEVSITGEQKTMSDISRQESIDPVEEYLKEKKIEGEKKEKFKKVAYALLSEAGVLK